MYMSHRRRNQQWKRCILGVCGQNTFGLQAVIGEEYDCPDTCFLIRSYTFHFGLLSLDQETGDTHVSACLSENSSIRQLDPETHDRVTERGRAIELPREMALA